MAAIPPGNWEVSSLENEEIQARKSARPDPYAQKRCTVLSPLEDYTITAARRRAYGVILKTTPHPAGQLVLTVPP